MTVISDTTPIISLIKINRLDLLQKLFNEILIPQAVYRELKVYCLFAHARSLSISSPTKNPSQGRA